MKETLGKSCAILSEMGCSDIFSLLTNQSPQQLATVARKTLTADERRFFQTAKPQWPYITWQRYAAISIPGDPDLKPRTPSVWYAPFYNVKAKLIVIISDREDFPYRLYGQNRGLYAHHGYTVLDFTEDLSCPVDDSAWENLMQIVGEHLLFATKRAA